MPSADQLIDEIKQKIYALRENELSYYLTLLLACIKNESSSSDYASLLPVINEFTDPLTEYYSASSADKASALLTATDKLNRLVDAAKPYQSYKLTNILLKITGVIGAIVCGIVLALVGLCIGPIAALRQRNYYLGRCSTAAGLGFFSGLLLGLTTGFRAPEKLVKSAFTRKLDFCMHNIQRVGQQLDERKDHSLYINETKHYIIETFFPELAESSIEEKAQAFETFLESTQQFQICTTTAGHISRRLKGYLGHHALIRFSINNNTDIPIEFGDRKRSPNRVEQYENPRTVSGQKLFEMLTLDRILQDTHQSGLDVALKIYNIGSDDCRTYVDKILIGTGQAPTKIKRFDNRQDRGIANRIVSPVFRHFNCTNEDELYQALYNLEGEEFEIHTSEPRT